MATSKKPPLQNQPSLFVEASHASQYPSLENKKEKMTIDGSSLKCFESLNKLNPNGSLQRMCKIFLTSQMEKSCKEFTMTWKLLITKSKLSVLALHRKELGTKGRESGSLGVYPTPTQDSASERTKKYKQGGTPLPMAVKMLPTPTEGNSQASNCLEARARRAGGKLSPKFVEFLMGYNTNWTRIEPKE